MNIDNLRNFVKDLFTLRTVWIDKGRGQWVVKKRMHPMLKGILCTTGLMLCAVVYVGIQTPRVVEADTQPVMVAKLPEPVPAVTLLETDEELAPPVQTQTQQNIIIPLTTKAAAASTILLPSETNPETDRIIGTVEKPAVIMPAPNDGKYSIKISKADYTLTLYKGDELVKSYPIAVGKNPGDKQRVGDNRTPVGDFKIVAIQDASGWTHDFRDGKGRIKGAYGPWFLRLDAKGWKGIGIHGTHDPDSRGTMATEGCIRLSNEDIAELKQYAYKNMPVIVRENWEE